MYNETSNCVPVCDCVKESSRAPLSELLTKLNDLSTKNLDLANLISDNLFGGDEPNKCSPPMPPVECMEDAIKSILENAYKTNALLTIIRERL